MEFTIERERFLGGIQRTLGVVEKQVGIPILANVLVRTRDGGIEIAATDREIGIVTDYDASVIEAGGVTIPARKLFETMRELQGETVHLKIGEGNDGEAVSTLTCGKAVCRIRSLSPEDYPELPVRDSAPAFQVSSALLQDMIRKVSFAVSKDELRKSINGVLFERGVGDHPTSIRMVATDGHRMAVVETELGDKGYPMEDSRSIIIPRKGIVEIRRIAEAEDGDVGIGFLPGAIIAQAGHALLKVSLIEGEYPEWRRVMPEESAAVIKTTVDRGSMLQSLRLMAVYGTACSLDFIEDGIRLSAVNPELGEIRDEIPAKYDQTAERIAKFNTRYMIDAIEAVSDPGVILHVPAAERGPCLIRGTDDKNCRSVVMPMAG